MADFSFDITSKVDLQEIDNAVNQAKKELANRYDFKGAKFSIDYNRVEKKITLVAGDDFKLRGIKDTLGMRLTMRLTRRKRNWLTGMILKAPSFRLIMIELKKR